MREQCPHCGARSLYYDADPIAPRRVCVMCSREEFVNIRSAKWQAEMERLRIESLANRKTGRPRKKQAEDQAG